jgi:hypothetical protein
MFGWTPHCTPGDTVRYLLLFSALLIAACGDDSSGPSSTDFSGTYSGRYYVIATSSTPDQRDSLDLGPASLTLNRKSESSYDISVVNQLGGTAGVTAPVTINSAGVFSFPGFDAGSILSTLSSSLLGLCDLSNASASPAGMVQNSRATLTIQVTGAQCDFGAGTGTPDVRPTTAGFTWTGTL